MSASGELAGYFRPQGASQNQAWLRLRMGLFMPISSRARSTRASSISMKEG